MSAVGSSGFKEFILSNNDPLHIATFTWDGGFVRVPGSEGAEEEAIETFPEVTRSWARLINAVTKPEAIARWQKQESDAREERN